MGICPFSAHPPGQRCLRRIGRGWLAVRDERVGKGDSRKGTEASRKWVRRHSVTCGERERGEEGLLEMVGCAVCMLLFIHVICV